MFCFHDNLIALFGFGYFYDQLKKGLDKEEAVVEAYNRCFSLYLNDDYDPVWDDPEFCFKDSFHKKYGKIPSYVGIYKVYINLLENHMTNIEANRREALRRKELELKYTDKFWEDLGSSSSVHQIEKEIRAAREVLAGGYKQKILVMLESAIQSKRVSVAFWIQRIYNFPYVELYKILGRVMPDYKEYPEIVSWLQTQVRKQICHPA